MTLIRRHWFAIAAGAFCFIWALAGWLTVIPNQDMLADSIQVQSLLNDPRIVLAFPGQKHGGPLEYPILLIAEAIAPGNFYLHTVFRLGFAFLTGFFTAKLYLTLFPQARKWSFLVAIAVGPTIIHGLLGPEGNRVGVWWLQPNWDIAWLLVTCGAYVIARQLNALHPTLVPSDARPISRRALVACAAGGLLFGLGIYAHPAISILAVPLASLVLIRFRISIVQGATAAGGVFVGLIPAGVSYLVNAHINTWDPSHGFFINVPMYGSNLGINGIPDYMLALLPYGLGLAPSGAFVPPAAQSILMWIFITICIAAAAIGIDRAWRTKSRLAPGVAIAVAWMIAALTMIVFATLVDPVWIYSSGLAILFWISVGVLPTAIPIRRVGLAATAFVLVVAAGSTFAHNAAWYADFPSRMAAKQAYLDDQRALATAIKAAGADYVYGSYSDAIPVGYASAYQLRTISISYNRFPLSEEERRAANVVAAVTTAPSDPAGVKALADVQGRCTEIDTRGNTDLGDFAIFRCPTDVLANPRP